MYEDIKDFIEYLYKEAGFFDNIEEINKYNIDAIAELIQYYNIKEHGSPLYKKNHIKKAIRSYLLK